LKEQAAEIYSQVRIIAIEFASERRFWENGEIKNRN
jgi:hypothetical protein